MEKGTEEKKTAAELVKLERKYIRLQGVGISFLVTTPLAVFLLPLFDLYRPMIVILTVFIMAGCGFLCLQIGEEKRNALRANNDNSNPE